MIHVNIVHLSWLISSNFELSLSSISTLFMESNHNFCFFLFFFSFCVFLFYYVQISGRVVTELSISLILFPYDCFQFWFLCCALCGSTYYSVDIHNIFFMQLYLSSNYNLAVCKLYFFTFKLSFWTPSLMRDVTKGIDQPWRLYGRAV